MDVQTTDTTQTTETVETQPVEITPALSVADHAAVYGPKADEKPDPDAPEGETREQKAERLHHSAMQKREKETGQFAEGKKPKPRNDWQAKVDQLTARSKENETRATAAETKLAQAEAELTRLRTAGAPKADIQRAEQKVERAEQSAASTFTEPEPKEDDAKYEGDYGKYLRELARWEGRKAFHDERTAENQRADEARRANEHRSKGEVFTKRVETARTKYAGFDAAADAVIAKVPTGSALESWFFEHPRAEDVVWFLHSHPDELDAIVKMPTPLEQFEAVTLLSQQFASPSTGQAETTRSAAAPKTIVLPKPPNLVRTEAQVAKDDPPPTDGSLSIAEHRKRFGTRR